jgi:competence protein ComEA
VDRRSMLFAIVPVFVVLAVLWWPHGPDPIEVPPVVTAAVTHPASITVHVAGWVVRPGVVSLPDGSRAADALAAAGGVLPGGDPSALNLAALLVDGVRIHVPGPGADPPPADPTDTKVSLNQATEMDLAELPGIGPVLASRIVAHRERNGPFEAIEDLLDVSGIGERTLSELRELVAVP